MVLVQVLLEFDLDPVLAELVPRLPRPLDAGARVLDAVEDEDPRAAERSALAEGAASPTNRVFTSAPRRFGAVQGTASTSSTR